MSLFDFFKNKSTTDSDPAQSAAIVKSSKPRKKRANTKSIQLSKDTINPLEHDTEDETTAKTIGACNMCGFPVKEGQKFCIKCETPLTKHVCSNCETELQEGQKFCPKCGSKDSKVISNVNTDMSLGFESVHMFPSGHAGTDITYNSTLRQVVIHSYCVQPGHETRDTIERIPIPEDIALRHSRSEILEYAKEKNATVAIICRE